MIWEHSEETQEQSKTKQGQIANPVARCPMSKSLDGSVPLAMLLEVSLSLRLIPFLCTAFLERCFMTVEYGSSKNGCTPSRTARASDCFILRHPFKKKS